MDVTVARTFLAVLATGSFVGAARQLHVTQSAISLRIQRLEDSLGNRLFTRSKSGAEMTVYGRQFEESARTFIQVWDEARYRIAIPDGFDSSLTMGCEDSLWPELSHAWLTSLEEKLPKVALNFQIDDRIGLYRSLLTGILDIAVVYFPEIRPGFQVEHILDDRLVMVTADPNHPGGIVDDYVYTDWGPEFGAAHSRWFPDFKLSNITVSLGTSVPGYLINDGKTAFLPYRMADDYVAAGQLHFVPDAPEFPFPAFAVWTTHKDEDVLKIALNTLRRAATEAPLLAL